MTARSSNCSVSAKFFPMLVKTPSFGGVIDPKSYLNHELGSKFFFLSGLAYKLVTLLVFEKCLCKMSKNWTFQKIIGLGLNFIYEFEACYISTLLISTFLHFYLIILIILIISIILRSLKNLNSRSSWGAEKLWRII